MAYKLDPLNFTCATHHDDLTDQVQAAVDALPLPVPRVGFAPFGRKRKKSGPFRVSATCPGAGTPHAVECRGTFSA